MVGGPPMLKWHPIYQNNPDAQSEWASLLAADNQAANAESRFNALLPALMQVSPAIFLAQAQARGAGRYRWREYDLIDTPGWHLSAFFLPAGAQMPLHDHPQMYAALRVLVGGLTLKIHDWLGDEGHGQLATPARVLRAARNTDARCLGPTAGNIHSLQAAQADTIFLDLFSPYYGEQRPCRYYRVEQTLPSAVRLTEVPEPEDAP